MVDAGVAVPPLAGDPTRGTGGSEFCLNRCEIPRRSPKLLRPLVEEDVRADVVRLEGGCWGSSCVSGVEFTVDDLCRVLPAVEFGLDERDLIDGADFVELCLCTARMGEDGRVVDRDGEGRGETWSDSKLSEATDLGVALVEADLRAASVNMDFASGPGRGFGGKGKAAPRFIFSRGRRNHLVLKIESSWAAGALWSSMLRSDLEDSESRTSFAEMCRGVLGRRSSLALVRVAVTRRPPCSSALEPDTRRLDSAESR